VRRFVWCLCYALHMAQRGGMSFLAGWRVARFIYPVEGCTDPINAATRRMRQRR